MKLFLRQCTILGLLATPKRAHSAAVLPSRRLSSKHLEVAEKNSKEVAEAMTSGVHGVAFPLNYVHLKDAEQQLTVALRVQGSDEDQHVLIDTGSSSLAFCNSSLATTSESLKTDSVQCLVYSSVDKCPNGDTGYPIGWAGSVYEGDVAVYDTLTGNEVARMQNASYAIMDSNVGFYACDGPMDGIIGVAFSGLNRAFKLPSDGSLTISDVLTSQCEVGSSQVLNCHVQNLTIFDLQSPLEQALLQDVNSDYTSVEAFGLYVDYEALGDAEVDTIIPGQGIYFGGNLALKNQFYTGGTPQVAKIPSVPAEEGRGEFYNLILQAIEIPIINKTLTYESYCSAVDGTCIADSGTSYLELPLSQEDCDAIPYLTEAELGSPLLIKLGSADGGTVTLRFPLKWIKAQFEAGWISCTGSSGLDSSFILGFPVFQHYYLVYDMGTYELTFVDLPQKQENTSTETDSNGNSSNKTSPAADATTGGTSGAVNGRHLAVFATVFSLLPLFSV